MHAHGESEADIAQKQGTLPDYQHMDGSLTTNNLPQEVGHM